MKKSDAPVAVSNEPTQIPDTLPETVSQTSPDGEVKAPVKPTPEQPETSSQKKPDEPQAGREATTDSTQDKGEKTQGQPAFKKRPWIPKKDFKPTPKSGAASSPKGESTYVSRGSGSLSDDRRKNHFRTRKRVLDTRNLHINYKDPEVLGRFISKTGKILPARAIGSTARVQRKIARAIKASRHIGLLPYSKR